MKNILLLICLLIPSVLFSQNINGNNNTVIIQIQGNNNNINNSSINNTDNYGETPSKPLTYKSTPNYFGYYTGYIYHTFKKPEKYELSLYLDGSFRLSIKGDIHCGTYTKTTHSRSNNTIKLYKPIVIDGYTGATSKYLFKTLYITNGEIQFGSVVLKEAIPGTTLKKKSIKF